MRTAFINELIAQARVNPDIFLVVGDLGFSVVEPFAQEFPDRYLNAGVAEQNMTGLAAGMASEGFHVFTYSIANFPTLRCLEQIRNDVCYHDLPVTVVAVGAGTAYGNLGYSHHCVQDIACLRGLPGMTLLSPGDPGEATACVQWLSANPGPSYLRLGKAGEAELHKETVSFDAPVRVAHRNGRVALCATGSVLAEAIQAGELSQQRGMACDVFSLARIDLSRDALVRHLGGYELVLTVEEHVQAGGIGEMLSAALGQNTRVERAFLPDYAVGVVGTQQHIRRVARLDAGSLVERVQALVSAGS